VERFEPNETRSKQPQDLELPGSQPGGFFFANRQSVIAITALVEKGQDAASSGSQDRGGIVNGPQWDARVAIWIVGVAVACLLITVALRLLLQ
jgi:hypothetical protein